MSSVLDEYRQFRDTLVNDIGKIERVLTDLETQYHQAEYNQAGSVFKGFDGLLASKENARKRTRSYKPEDRLFTLSSRSSPATREMDPGGADLVEAPLAVKKMGNYAQKGYAQKGYAQKQAKR